MLESGDKGLSLVEYRPALPTIDTISVVPAVPERPLQQLGSCRQHKPQGCGKSTEGGRMLGDHRGTLGLNVASIWLPASSRASTMGVIWSTTSHRGGNAVAEIVGRGSYSRTHLNLGPVIAVLVNRVLAQIHRWTAQWTVEGSEGVTGAMIRARIRVDGRLAGGPQGLLGAPVAACSGCSRRDGRIGHGDLPPEIDPGSMLGFWTNWG